MFHKKLMDDYYPDTHVRDVAFAVVRKFFAEDEN
jgi:hypothetical protein